MTYKNKHILPALLISILSQGLFIKAASAETESTLNILIEQANYWHERSQDELAVESLNKVLTVDTDNAEALYLMALWSIEKGDTNAAEQWKKRLAEADPNAPQLQALATAKQLKDIPESQLTLAREQANSGNTAEALSIWENIFEGDEPPLSLAPEYYLTMSADKSRYEEARQKLAQLNTQHPQNKSVALAYAKVQTFNEKYRRKGIELLNTMADSNTEADTSLRQALLWLSPNASDEKTYEAWMQRHPKDSEILKHYESNVLGEIQTKGFNDLNANRLNSAAQKFEQILKVTPNNTEALAGLGYVRYREKNYSEANKYLSLAAQQGGAKSATYQQQANEAAFYIKFEQAKQAYRKGNLNQALQLTSTLSSQPGSQGIAVKLFRADIQRKSKNYSQAETTLKSILKTSPNNHAANEMLYYVLRDQGKFTQAENLLNSFSSSLKTKIASTDDYQNISNKVEIAVQNGNTQEAITILREGIIQIPNSPWLRLDLARLLEEDGQTLEARAVLSTLEGPNASKQDLYAAALFFNEQGEWKKAIELLERIPSNTRDNDIKDLIYQANFNIEIKKAEDDIYYGRRISASSTLNKLSTDVKGKPANAGRIARLMSKNGELNSAVDVIRSSLSEGVKGDVTNYIEHIIVLREAGFYQESLSLLNNTKLLANSTPEQIHQVNNAYTIFETQLLIDEEKYAAAYDHLVKALQEDPRDTDLMLAMARLYQTGKMNKEAKAVYDYLLSDDTPTQEARVGAINIALAENDAVTARQLANELKDTQSPDRLVLLARISDAEGNNQQALANLRAARGQLIGFEMNDLSTSPMVGGLVLADNPFNTAYDTAMPWQVNKTSKQSQIKSETTTHRIDLPMESERYRALTEIDNMLNRLNEETATWVQGDIGVRGRDGESGLSQLTEAKATMKLSLVPMGNWRLDMNVTPISLNAGTSSGDASRRFGTGALIQGEVAADAEAQAEAEAIAAAEEAGEEIDADADYTLATLPDVSSQGSQSTSGVELGIVLTGYDFTFDLGTTPLGADLTTLVGGISWAPKLSDYLRLTLKGERRPVTDSLLSYVGTTDTFSGRTWGQVTKNGVGVQLGYDNGDAGLFVGGGGWGYIGTDVTSNTSIDFTTGAYFRPLLLDDRSFKTGINVSYMNFSKNVSQYSLGHGGYFSPQNYISISFPQEYKQQFANLGLLVGVSVGYQAYSEDETAYFSNDADLQAQLESYVEEGQAKEAYYEASSVSGVGYNIQAGLDYKVSNNMTFGGRVYYDTFGDYNEYTGQLWLRHTFGAN